LILKPGVFGSYGVGLGRGHARWIVTVAVSETTLAIDLDDGETKVVRRTTTYPVTSTDTRHPGRQTI
jgi:hypothetical protein